MRHERTSCIAAHAAEFFAEQYREAHPHNLQVEIAAELAARLGLSLVLTPQTRAHVTTDDDIRAFARRYVLALI